MTQSTLRATVRTLVAISMLLTATMAAAERHALLVGVSAYPALRAELQLRGPRNDVALVRTLLQAHGFDRGNIRVLADGIDDTHAQPRRAAILAELQRLADRADRGDFIYVHFAGHGAQQPTRPGKPQPEPDGLDELFLPQDVGPWDGSVGAVRNAIRDDEIGTALARIRARGAFVWAVFDTCHAGDITRAAVDDEVRERRVVPAGLGIPPAEIEAAQQAAARADPNAPPERGWLGASGSASGWGGYVYFFAAQPGETTPERPLPEGDRDRRPRGLFTYTLLEVLATSSAATYRQIGERLLQRYAARGVRAITPLFEGDSLDAGAFGQTLRAASRQWPLRRGADGLEIPAGALHGLDEGARLVLLAHAAERNDQALGELRATRVELLRAVLEPASGPLPANLPADAVARLVELRPRFALRVALASEGATTPPSSRARRVIDALRRDPPEGLSIEWVEARQPADLRLHLSEDVLWLLPADGMWVRSGAARSPSVALSQTENELREALVAALRRIARATHLLRIASSNAAGATSAEPLSLGIAVERNDGRQAPGVATSDIVSLAPRDRLAINIENRALTPFDITILSIDGRYGIELIYPGAESNRLRRRERISIRVRGDGEASGRGLIVVLAVEAEPLTPPLRLDFLAQAQIVVRRDALPSGLDDEQRQIWSLLAGAGTGAEVTRGLGPNASRRLIMRTLHYELVDHVR